jgi:glycine/D-amino acid oxidase-like deaminating enzyme
MSSIISDCFRKDGDMSKATGDSSQARGKRLTRRRFLQGAAVGGAGVWAASVLPRRAFMDDPHRPPKLYEYFLDNFWFETVGLYGESINPPLKGRQLADIAIVGGGFAGMSAAYNLRRRFPDKRIVLLEGACCGYGASGRNGGFADAGMPGLGYVYESQGPEAARAYYDATLLGMRQIQTFVGSHGVDCDFEMNGLVMLATEDRHLEELAEAKRRFDEMGVESALLDQAAVREGVHSERFIGGLREPHHAILNPAKLARGIKQVIESMGVVVSERSKVMRIETGRPLRILTEFAEVRADQAVIALNGYAPQLGFFRNRLIPLCNYVAATEPLSQSQLAGIGWGGREGLADRRVDFMYLRLTADNRIVFGGESAPYFYESSPSSGNYRPSLDKLHRSLLSTFPQLEGVRFTHGWGGTMGFTADFVPSVGTLGDAGNLFYAVAFNGEGVVMTQLAGQILSQLMAGEDSDLTRLALVNKSMPYVGHEPLRYAAIKLYERLLQRFSANPVQ